MKNPIPRFLHLFLRRAGIRIDELRIRAVYDRHPLPHSIRSLRDTLGELHAAAELHRPAFGQLPEFERPFIVTAGTDEYPFFLVESMDVPGSTVRGRSVSGRRCELSFEQFRALWSGTLLTLRKSEKRPRENLFAYCLRQGAARIGFPFSGSGKAAQEAEQLKAKHEQLLGSPETFWQLLIRQPEMPTDSATVRSVSNYAESDHSLTVILDPANPACARAFQAVAKLEYFRIDLIFSVDPSNIKACNAALRMISSGIRDSWADTSRIIAGWYEKHTLPAELDVHPLAQNDLDAQSEYCRASRILTTPTVLIDNRRLPSVYDAEDLPYLL